MAATWKDPAKRRQKLAAIHVAKSQLAMDEHSYRQLLARVSAAHGDECTSAAELSERQSMDVLDEMRRLGANLQKVQTKRGPTRPASYPGKPDNFEAMPEQIAKIEAQLASMGLSWAYADAIAKRMFKTDRVAWLQTSTDRYGLTITQQMKLVAILAALDVEQEKRNLLSAVSQQAAELGITLESLAVKYKLPAGWQRRRITLRALLARFEIQRELAEAAP